MSLSYKKPVTEVIYDKWSKTFGLAILALVFEIVFGIYISFLIICFDKHKSVRSISEFLIVLSLSLPVFVVGILLIKWFCYDIRLLPMGGFESSNAGFVGIRHYFDVLIHLLLPAFTLSAVSIGGFVKLMVNSMYGEMDKQQYILYAKSRGFGRWDIVSRFAFRNVRIPLLWYIINSIPYVFGGAIVVEKLFAIDGLGNLAYSAAMSRDFPLLMGYTFIFGVLTLACNFVGDIVYKSADKRIKEV